MANGQHWPSPRSPSLTQTPRADYQAPMVNVTHVSHISSFTLLWHSTCSLSGKEGDTGIRGEFIPFDPAHHWWPTAHCVAQLHAVFSISLAAWCLLFPVNNQPPEHLAYFEWFGMPFWPTVEANSQLYKVSWAHHLDAHVASVIPLGNICQESGCAGYRSKWVGDNSRGCYSWNLQGAEAQQEW